MAVRGPDGRFIKGNQAAKGYGRPTAEEAQIKREALPDAFLTSVYDDFRKHGKQALADAREANPVGYLSIIARVIPKQVEIGGTVEVQFTDLLKEVQQRVVEGEFSRVIEEELTGQVTDLPPLPEELADAAE